MGKVKELCEITWSDLEVTEELDKTSKIKRMRIIGQVQEADTVNINNRLYPKAVLQDAIDDMTPKVKAGQIFGEIDHPDIKAQLKESSHLVTNLWWKKDSVDKETNRLMGEMLVFNTPVGEIVKEIVRAGGRPGFSSRGSGDSTPITVKGHKDKVDRIDKGFKLESFDFVIDPSVKNAQIHNIIESHLGGSNKIVKEVKSMDLTLDVIKKDHSELVDKLKQEWQAEADAAREKADKEKKDQDKEKDATKEKDAQKQKDEELESLKGTIKKLKDRIAELEKESEAKDQDMDRHLDTITSIIELLRDGGYIETDTDIGDTDTGDDGDDDDEKEALARDLATAQEKIKSVEKEKETVVVENTQLKEEAQKAGVEAYLTEKTEGEPFGALFRERLKDCKTKEEVDEGIKGYKEFAESVVSDETTILDGKGRTKKVTEEDDDVALEKKVSARTKGMANLRKKEEA